MTSVVLAKALYSNDSEADDELSFKKGDIVSVLETDYEGMQGWWLCSLGEREGVAPGNRLQLISYGEVETEDPNEIYDTPGSAYKETYQDYDVPKPHMDLSPTSQFQDYAIPKSPYGGIPVPESQRHGFVLPSPHMLMPSDVRNSNSSDGMVSNEIYDAPSRWSSERSSDEFRFSGEVYQESGPEEIYDVPSRNSMESDDGVTPQQGDITLRVPDLPPKTSTLGYHNNSGSQDGQDIYDSPASATLGITDVATRSSEDLNEVYDELPLSNDGEKLSVLLQSLSDENNIYQCIPDEIYDVPAVMSDDGNPTMPEDIYDVPPGELTQTSFESRDFGAADGNNNPPSPFYCEDDEIRRSSQAIPDQPVYDVPEVGGMYDNFDMSDLEEEMRLEEMMEEMKPKSGNEKRESGLKNRKNESESDDYVDYQEIYGMGKEEPQDAKVGEQVNNENSVFERINMEKVRELRITRSVAMANLDKLQQAIDVAVTKLLSFVTEDWRQPGVLELNINGIRDISGKVKVALRLLTEFGLGTLVNSQKLNDREIFRKIKEALEPLLHTYYSIKSAIQRLDETDWKSAYQMRGDDELNSISEMAQGIPCDAYNLGAIIANISSLLFDKTNEQSGSGYEVNKSRTLPQRPPQSYSPPATAQKGSVKGLELKKVESEPVGIKMKMLVTSKQPPKVSPKPKRNENAERKSGASGEPLSETVSELTNNLLNQIEDMKTPSPGLRRKESKRLSPKTVRRLCSIGLKDDDKNEKIFEDVAAVPAKPSRLCSSSMESEDTRSATLDGKVSSTGTEKSSSSLSNHRDREPRRENGDAKNVQLLNSFVGEMASEVVILKEGIKNFRESVRDCQIPKVFVAHSKFIVLSAHKLLYIGDGASRDLADVNTQKRISEVTNSLSETINDFVENIKIAARQYPNENAMNGMIRTVAKVTEKALELYKTLKEHAES